VFAERGLGQAFRHELSLALLLDRAPSSSDFGPRWTSHQRGPFSSTALTADIKTNSSQLEEATR